MGIQALLDKKVIAIIQQLKQDLHDQDTGNGNVQSLEIMEGECEKQLIAVAEEGGELHRCDNQEEQGEAGRKWQEFAKIVWDTSHGEVTESMQELNSYIGQDVNQRIRGMCERCRVDVRNHFTRFNEREKELDQWIDSVVNAAEDRLGENNHRGNNQERMLEQINATLLGLNGKMGPNRKDTRQIHENKPRWRKEWKKIRIWALK